MATNSNLINAQLNLVAPGRQEIAQAKVRYDALEKSFKALDSLVYRPNSIRGALKSLVKDNIIIDENEWVMVVAKKKALAEEMEEVMLVLKLLQSKMDDLLVNLPAE